MIDRKPNAEQSRLAETASERALAALGAVPERAPVGHGARGLQPGRQRLGLLHARSGALARLPLGRGRPRRHLRRSPAPLLRARAVERARSDPQGAAVRSRQQRRQPWRGRQGVLLLSRLDADALVHEVSVQVPAGGVSLRGPGQDQPASARDSSRSTSCSTPACSPATATSTSGSSTPRLSPDDLSIRITVTNRGPEPAEIHLLPTLFFRNTWAGATAANDRCSRPSPVRAAPAWCARAIPSWASATSTPTARCRCSSPATRPTPSGCGTNPTPHPG